MDTGSGGGASTPRGRTEPAFMENLIKAINQRFLIYETIGFTVPVVLPYRAES